MEFNTVEDLFKELDEQKFHEIAKPLAAYRSELMKNGFTRREAMRLVEAYSKFTYDIAIENMISERNQEAIDEFNALDEEEEFSEFDDDDAGEVS